MTVECGRYKSFIERVEKCMYAKVKIETFDSWIVVLWFVFVLVGSSSQIYTYNTGKCDSVSDIMMYINVLIIFLSIITVCTYIFYKRKSVL